MITHGIILVFWDLDTKVPVVVRLSGTNEESGQKMVMFFCVSVIFLLTWGSIDAKRGLPLYTFDGFEAAAKKVIVLTSQDPIHEPTPNPTRVGLGAGLWSYDTDYS